MLVPCKINAPFIGSITPFIVVMTLVSRLFSAILNGVITPFVTIVGAHLVKGKSAGDIPLAPFRPSSPDVAHHCRWHLAPCGLYQAGCVLIDVFLLKKGTYTPVN